jgi:hypothetical protein
MNALSMRTAGSYTFIMPKQLLVDLAVKYSLGRFKSVFNNKNKFDIKCIVNIRIESLIEIVQAGEAYFCPNGGLRINPIDDTMLMKPPNPLPWIKLYRVHAARLPVMGFDCVREKEYKKFAERQLHPYSFGDAISSSRS